MSRCLPPLFAVLAACAPYDVLDPSEAYEGRTLGERGADWWTWVYETPVDGHPVIDTTGADCATNQPADVFYLAGTFGGDASRTCTVPKGRPVLVPLVNYSYDNCGVPEEFHTPPEEFGAEIDAFLDSLTELELTVDGDVIGDSPSALAAYRVDLVDYEYDVAETGSVYEYFGLEYSGNCSPVTSGGYYALIELAPGEHDISFSAATADFSVAVDYALTVE